MLRLALAAALLVAAPARAEEPSDLRDLRVGATVPDLPQHGYTGLACDATPDTTLASWQDYTRCPADEAGLHAVRFRYDTDANPRAAVNDAYQGTRVGGHPVLLALLIGDDAVLHGIRIATDPAARLYLRKKAFLLGEQARQRYGADGWACRDSGPTGDEVPVGGVFIRQHCEKTTEARHIVVDRQLYGHAGQPVQAFTGASQVLILSRG